MAQGRVWIGDDALERGLVDRIGTLDQAIDLALERAGVPDWRQVEIRDGRITADSGGAGPA